MANITNSLERESRMYNWKTRTVCQKETAFVLKDHVMMTYGELEVKLHALLPAVLDESDHKVFRSDGKNYFKESWLE
jgi:hypothetical protein